MHHHRLGLCAQTIAQMTQHLAAMLARAERGYILNATQFILIGLT